MIPVIDTLRLSLWMVWQSAASRAGPERIQALQQRRFRRLLRHAVARSTFYREKYRGLDTDRCPLAALPTTTKAEVMADFDRVVTDPRVRRADLERFIDHPENVGRLFLDTYPVCHTSGSQGQPMLVVQDHLSLDLLFAFQMTRGNTGYRQLGPLDAVRRLVSPARMAVLISKPGFFPSAWAWRHLPRGLHPYVRLLYLPASDPDLAAKLAAFRPTILTATPTALDLLAVRPDRPTFPALRQVVTWSETLTDAARDRLHAAYGVPVLNLYAMGECMFLTAGCPTHPGSHVNADWAILEVVDEAGRPVPPGEFGHKVLLTNLANTTQPLIRYEIGDRVKMAAGPCGCGSRLPRIESVQGRSAEVFWVRSGSGYRPLTAYPFQHALEYFRGVREWQATQEDRNRVVVRVELLPGATLDRAAAERRIAERLGLAGFRDEVAVDLVIVPRLASDAGTGKFRRVISRVGPPDDPHPSRTPRVEAGEAVMPPPDANPLAEDGAEVIGTGRATG